MKFDEKLITGILIGLALGLKFTASFVAYTTLIVLCAVIMALKHIRA